MRSIYVFLVILFSFFLTNTVFAGSNAIAVDDLNILVKSIKTENSKLLTWDKNPWIKCYRVSVMVDDKKVVIHLRYKENGMYYLNFRVVSQGLYSEEWRINSKGELQRGCTRTGRVFTSKTNIQFVKRYLLKLNDKVVDELVIMFS